MIQSVLAELDGWYREPTQGSHRPKLLAKMAVLELCGWLEGEFDRLITLAQTGRLDDEEWMRTHVLERTNGFAYNEHFRPMLAKVFGEFVARRVEARMEELYAGDLERLKSLLGILWKQRCTFAHADVAANVASQQTFSAPSWSINQHRIVSRLIANYENAMTQVLAGM